ncbi:MAG: hypothetical protein FWF21_07395 [Micrococcales bacterium]|nr:hypothetical protein [Micrococcales bacterium]
MGPEGYGVAGAGASAWPAAPAGYAIMGAPPWGEGCCSAWAWGPNGYVVGVVTVG